jgi:hypothetical protein
MLAADTAVTCRLCVKPVFVKAAQLCQMHYTRLLRTGTTERLTAEQVFWSRIDRRGDCWLWIGPVNRQGYGICSRRLFGSDGSRLAHRRTYEFFVGRIPRGKDLDHQVTCLKNCVNPAHLRPVTDKQNGENRAVVHASSGERNVYPHSYGRWYVQVMHNREKIHGGTFDTIEQAATAARALRNKLFTHNDVDRRGHG